MLDNLSKSLARFHQVHKAEVEKLNEMSETIGKIETFFKIGMVAKPFNWTVPLIDPYVLSWEPHCSNGKYRLRLHYRDDVGGLKKVPLRECKHELRLLICPYLSQFVDAFTIELLKDKDE